MPKIQSTGEDTYRRLRRMVIDGRFSEGQRLVEADLVETLGVPRMAVRQALARLEYDGLLVKQAGRSSVVRAVSLAELEEIAEARMALEAIAIRRVALLRTPTALRRMEELADRMSALLETVDVSAFVEAQAALHHVWLEASGMLIVPHLVESLSAQSAQTRVRTVQLPDRMRQSLAEHREIVAAVRAGDPDRAEVAVRTHLTNVKESLRRSLQSR
ncbi:GntR family transcriptional regulator [Pseudonocardia xishanensis]|uniref:GntR family transcriptional regulator n=1 Tax=Pseudonocardia xishanensis TaxID=630995 RepID=A0ABP8RWJ9_9PSEU